MAQAREIFISHASRDAQLATEVCDTLESGGFECWIAPRNIEPGDDYPTALAEALNGCRALVVIVSSAANASVHVTREVERAVSNETLIVPVLIDGIDLSPALEYLIGSVQRVDAIGSRRGHAPQLILQTLQHHLGIRRHSTQPMSMTTTRHGSGPVAPASKWRRNLPLQLALGTLVVFAVPHAVQLVAGSVDRTVVAAPVAPTAATEVELHPRLDVNSNVVPPNPDGGVTVSLVNAPGSSAAGGATRYKHSAPAPVPPAPSRLCCTESGIGKTCARPHCEECGLRECQ